MVNWEGGKSDALFITGNRPRKMESVERPPVKNGEESSSSSAFLCALYSSSIASLAAVSMGYRWIRPEVYPLFASVSVAVGICAMQLVRNICTNPEVRVNKENRAAGILENFSEGERYAEHSLRKFVRNRSPEIMPSINSFFADPK